VFIPFTKWKSSKILPHFWLREVMVFSNSRPREVMVFSNSRPKN
jgi:hypothetical protein